MSKPPDDGAEVISGSCRSGGCSLPWDSARDGQPGLGSPGTAGQLSRVPDGAGAQGSRAAPNPPAPLARRPRLGRTDVSARQGRAPRPPSARGIRCPAAPAPLVPPRAPAAAAPARPPAPLRSPRPRSAKMAAFKFLLPPLGRRILLPAARRAEVRAGGGGAGGAEPLRLALPARDLGGTPLAAARAAIGLCGGVAEPRAGRPPCGPGEALPAPRGSHGFVREGFVPRGGAGRAERGPAAGPGPAASGDAVTLRGWR